MVSICAMKAVATSTGTEFASRLMYIRHWMIVTPFSSFSVPKFCGSGRSQKRTLNRSFNAISRFSFESAIFIIIFRMIW